jgi:hypothetical protein
MLGNKNSVPDLTIYCEFGSHCTGTVQLDMVPDPTV